jgi:Flp pilus assembly protein TadB
MDLLAIVVLGALVGAAALLLVWAMTPREQSEVVRPPTTLLQDLARLASRVPLAVGAGLLVLVLTRWPVLAGAAAILAFVGPSLVGGAAVERRAMARLEGLASWTESLRDTIAGAVGLEQAIPATAYAASPAIQRELAVLSDRLRVRTPLALALQRFADDLDDAGADLIVAALILNAQLRGPGLRKVLTSLAESTRDELEMRRRINAGRASTRRSVQIVVGVTVVFVFGLSVFNRGYVEPYTGPVGQLVLLVILAMFAAGFWWMKRLSVFELPERFLFTDPGRR